MSLSSSEEYYGRRGLRGFARDLRWALQDRTPIPFNSRLKATRAGFKPVSAVAYDFQRNDPRDYLPDTSWLPLAKTNGPAAWEILANKLLFYREFSDELPLPRVYAYMAAGHLVPVAAANGASRSTRSGESSAAREAPAISSLAGVLDHLCQHGSLVVKPMGGDRGRGVHLLEARDGEYLKDCRPLSKGELVEFLGRRDGSLFVEKVDQAAYSKQIFPDASNSLRLMVFGGAGTANSPFMPVAVHRFGRNSSIPVDNTAKGGLASPVDPRTGVLAQCRLLAPGAPRYQHYDRHPDSGAVVAGVEVPGFADVVEALLDFSRRHPYLAYVGWDIINTESGFMVLEANHHASLRTQVGHPYLKDERIVSYLAHHGLLPRR